MAVPARRVSKTRKRKRQTNKGMSVPGMVKCSNCGAMIKAHRACPECGYYKNKNVMEESEEVSK